jgi:outer membrane receptor for ferrienterochelin and colicin
MSILRCLFSATFLSLYAGFAALAQPTTGALTGKVTSDGIALPGATITISSPNLQGTRIAISDTNGNYYFASLPPGDYSVKVELSDMQTVISTARVGLATTVRVDADLRLSIVTETITVTAGAEPIMESAQVVTNLPATLIDDLPVARTLLATSALAPGVQTNTVSARGRGVVAPGFQLQISGSPGYDNLIMVNGASIQENIFGLALDLFIEDAIQETTVLTGAVSAEYGRFSGGVVNSITRSGGNKLSGSLRGSLTNASWSANRPGENITTDKINPVYEATLGGYVLRDRLWFFLAGHDQELDTDLLTSHTNIPYAQGTKDTRYEYKLTGAISPRHNVVGSFLQYDRSIENTASAPGPIYDLGSTVPLRRDPMTLIAGHYSGILSSNFLAEAHYAKRDWDLGKGMGGLKTDDFAADVPGWDFQTGSFFNAPMWCRNCDVETRDSRSYTLKGTYYLATSATGSHNLVAGYDDFSESRHANNFYSAVDWAFGTAGIVRTGSTPIISANGFVYPILFPGGAFLVFTPIFDLSNSQSDLRTRSLYFNDRWDFSHYFTFNIGARYDEAHARDANGRLASDDKAISPRLTAIYDVRGNGRHRITGGYNRYVSKVGEGPGTATESAGKSSMIFFRYGGPPINFANGVPVANLDSRAAFAQAWSWFLAQGGVSNTGLIAAANIPGYDSRFIRSLEAPFVDEYIFGYGTQLTTNAYARADYIRRHWREFYAYFLDQSAPQQKDPLGVVHDVATVGNTNDISREYEGLHFQLGWRPNRFSIAVNYTYATLRGNDMQESSLLGTVGNSAGFQYCEVLCYANHNPEGYLPGDQRHRARAWVVYDIPTPEWLGGLNVALLQNFDSGTPYSAIGTVNPRTYAAAELGTYTYAYSSLSSTGYPYYFSKRGGYRADDITSTDVAVNYRRGISRGQAFFAEAEILNVFNEQGIVAVNALVYTKMNDPSLAVFDPRTEAPVEGTHWKKDPRFGQPTGPDSYQQARMYRFSLGIRF